MLVGPYATQALSALQAVGIDASGRVVCRGRRRTLVPRAARALLAPAAAERLLHRELQWTLYTDFYCTGGGPLRPLCRPLPAAATQPFVAALASANEGRGCWDGGWVLVPGPDGPAVRRDGLEVRTGTSGWRVVTDGPEGAVELRLPKHLPGAMPGYYLALGDRALRPGDYEHGVRVYWNVTAGGAIALMRMLTRELNREGVPFRFKVLTDLACFRRCDSAVLYLHARDLEPALPLLAAVFKRVAGGLLSSTPAFTRPLAPGLAVAESPPGGQSFGLHRCGLLAGALREARARAVRTRLPRLEVVADHLRRHGVALERPYAPAGSALLESAALPGDARSPTASRHGRRRRGGSGDAFLRAARRIGARLVERAVWAGDRCTWIGSDGPDDPGSSPNGPATFSPLGGDVYAGTGGVALFLAELAVVTAEPAVRRTALGAARHALSRAAGGDEALGGLYTGGMSAALAGAYAGVRLDARPVGDAARELARRLAARTLADSEGVVDTSEVDLLSGLAGSVVALLALAEVTGDGELGRLAIPTGNRLLARAERGEHGLSWRSSVAGGGPNLLGLAHGAAGVAQALAELYAVTGRSHYRAAALAGLCYERAWFDRVRRNWPTLLGARPTLAPQHARRLPAQAHWCHGAPGIALARLRAHELLGGRELAREARVALESTAAAVMAVEDVRLDNFSLCHGLAGSASILLEGAAALSDPDPGWRESALRVARAGLVAHRSPETWVCGNRTLGAPGFMLGLAGIGMFYLRLFDPCAPSFLLVRPDRLGRRARG